MYSKLTLFTIFNVFTILVGYAQVKETIEVSLHSKKVNPLPFNIYCDSLIDMRSANTKNWQISRVNKKGFRDPIGMKLEGGFASSLKDHLNNVILQDKADEQFIFVIRDLQVYESSYLNTRQGECSLEIEFIKYDGEGFISYGSYDTRIINRVSLKQKAHLKNINQAFLTCIKKYARAVAQGETGTPVHLEDLKVQSFEYTNVAPEGHYASFRSLVKNKPDSDLKIVLEKTVSKNLNNYKLKAVNGISKQTKGLFISDGENLLINASSYSSEYHYTMAKYIGKYIFFEDRVSNSSSAAAFGLTGALASNKKRAIILNTDNGRIEILSKTSIIPYIKDHEDILIPFNNSKQNIEDIEKAIVSLNAKF